MALIEACNLEKTYRDGELDTAALLGVSVTIEAGEFVAIMGPSGSGKSTLLHILGLLDRPTAGEYRFEGKTISDFSDNEIARVRNQKMGFVFQAFNLMARTSVLENVKLPLIYADSVFKDSEATARAKKALASVGLLHRISHEPSQLSGGERQRVAIARALVCDPQVIFADEPTGNLDTKSGEAVIQILQDLNKKEGRTIVLITHEKEIAERARRIIYIKDGKIESDLRAKTQRNAPDNL